MNDNLHLGKLTTTSLLRVITLYEGIISLDSKISLTNANTFD